MKHNKNKYMVNHVPHSVKGFTLIEFLVASILAMIVIVAAGSTYMITRKLNTNVQERISVQQDIRNASVQMARDARMAGSFGCFSTGGSTVAGNSRHFSIIAAKNAAAKNLVVLDPTVNDGFGVRLIPASDLSGVSDLKGLSKASDGLLFIYGQSPTAAKITTTTLSSGSPTPTDISSLSDVFIKDKDEADVLKRTLESKDNDANVILSTCSEIVRAEGIDNVSGSAKNGYSVTLKPTQININTQQANELSLSQLHASLYVLGEINKPTQNQWDDERALLRYDLGADGKWQNPQLLATGIADISFSFGYVDKTNACKNAPTSSTNSEHFFFTNDPVSNTIGKELPALVQVRLKYYANKRIKASDTVANNAQIRDYIINTTVRGGNVCANRLTS